MTPIPGRRADHQGVRIQLLGEVELAVERGHPHQFLSLGALRCAALLRVYGAECWVMCRLSAGIAGWSAGWVARLTHAACALR